MLVSWCFSCERRNLCVPLPSPHPFIPAIVDVKSPINKVAHNHFLFFFIIIILYFIDITHMHSHEHIRANVARTHLNRSLLHLYCSLSLRTYKLYDAAETIRSRTRASVFFFPFCDEQSNKFNKEMTERAAMFLMIWSVAAGGAEARASCIFSRLKCTVLFKLS